MDVLDTAPPASIAAAEAAAPEPNSTAANAPRTVCAPAVWSPLTRLGFRIAFIYFVGFLYLYGNDSMNFTFNMGIGFNSVVQWPMEQLARWIGYHIFHLTGLPTQWHINGAGDTLINWVLYRAFASAAIIGGLAWTVIAWFRGSRRTEYRTLFSWLRFLLRLAISFYMIAYGMVKVFLLQMPPVSLAVLNRPTGSIGSSGLLYSLIGAHPWYEFLCGVAEVTGGTLVLFRRTALAGMLICVFIMSNVVLYNFFFDVTVKLFALNLLLAEIFMILPDARPLFGFFWRHEPAAPTAPWAPYDRRWQTKFLVRTLEVVFVIASLLMVPLFDGILGQHQRAVARIQSPLLGGWRVDSLSPANGYFLTSGNPVVELYINSVERAYTVFRNDGIWRDPILLNSVSHTLLIHPPLLDPVVYRWELLDQDHLLLTPIRSQQSVNRTKMNNGSAKADRATITLTRIPLPNHYPLLEPSFDFPIDGHYYGSSRPNK